MGGNAMKPFGAKRITAKQKTVAIAEITEWAYTKGFSEEFEPVLELSDKDSYGDIDIVYSANQNIDVGSRPSTVNGNVTSTVWLHSYGVVQVDFIKVLKSCFDFACQYYAFNDMGNLLGRVASHLGFSLGHTGLHYKYTDEYSKVHKLLVTTDWQKAMTLLGYGIRPDSLDWEAMVSYVTSSEYFCTAPFLLSNRNHKARTRDSKRASYGRFLDEIMPRQDHSHRVELDNLAVDRNETMRKAFRLKPSMLLAISAIETEQKLKHDARAKLNGDMVRDLTSLSGKYLGFLMKSLREPGWEQWAVESTLEQISQAVLKEYDRMTELGMFTDN